MGKKRKAVKKRRTTRRKKSKENSIVSFFKSERTHFLSGVIVAFVGLFIFLSMISFLFTGGADQSKVTNKTFFELVNDKTLSVDNWTGAGGAFIAQALINDWLGIFSLLIPVFITLMGIRWMKVWEGSLSKSFIFISLAIIFGSISSAFILDNLFSNTFIKWGGEHGNVIVSLLESSIGLPGILLLIILFATILVVLYKKTSMFKIQDTLSKGIERINNNGTESEVSYDTDEESEAQFADKRPGILRRIVEFFGWKKSTGDEDESNKETDSFVKETSEETSLKKPTTKNDAVSADASDDFEVIVPEDETTIATDNNRTALKDNVPMVSDDEEEQIINQETGEVLEEFDPKKDLSSFQFPSMDLLKIYNVRNKVVDMREQNENKDKIIRTLKNYGVEIKSIKATIGPTLTLYEIVPAAGVRISRIRNLEDDIALSLAALGIRIIAPMPGKGTVGIEVPNKDPQIVSMQSIIASKRFQECDYDLPVALGRTITNEIFMFDLCKMPHLLVAGATGQGKSVGLNAIITSLLYKKHPAEMKMVLIDPKMVEFNIYSTIEKHYLAKLPDSESAIITDVTKVTQTLNSLTKEMDDRYELLMQAHVRNIKEYNYKFKKRRLNPKKGHRFLPYIVVVIDEFGDLIMTAGKEIEMPIARIAQKARAVGMHMVIATQRPTTNIITGTIKANFPARMAFRVTSQIDSRTILDMSGANQLIGRGDMLFSQGSHLVRIQCAFVDTPEVEGIAQYIGKQRGYETAFELPEYDVAGTDKSGSAVDVNEKDVLFDEAARLIVVHQQGSTSLIQRKFSIGYNRAGRIMDTMEAFGIVGPQQGNKPRDVYIADEYSLEKILNSLE
ncbi:MAG TPA: DNA translocase FtsK 4TM domain-containing protein [Dysgonamonadaceae bacterium]|nr:DNA translocase FtsK 4TM domain-containing protein [Dysgonamonadaceae bacterium]